MTAKKKEQAAEQIAAGKEKRVPALQPRQPSGAKQANSEESEA